MSGGDIITDKQLDMTNFFGLNDGNIYCRHGIKENKIARIIIDMNEEREINRIHYSSKTSEG